MAFRQASAQVKQYKAQAGAVWPVCTGACDNVGLEEGSALIRRVTQVQPSNKQQWTSSSQLLQ